MKDEYPALTFGRIRAELAMKGTPIDHMISRLQLRA